MPFIEVVDYENAQGRLKEIYESLLHKRGKLARVHTVQSLNPESIVLHMDLYVHIMFGKSPLRRYQREMLGMVVSKYNKCEYCVAHHGVALNHFWKDPQKLKLFEEDYRTAGLTKSDVVLCEYAEKLTLHPHTVDEDFHQRKFRDHGFHDRQILDASLVIAYFNFVNRLVLGLGVDLEADGGKGYRYD